MKNCILIKLSNFVYFCVVHKRTISKRSNTYILKLTIFSKCSPLCTLSNRLQMRTKKYCAFTAKQLAKRNIFWCVFATYSTVCCGQRTSSMFTTRASTLLEMYKKNFRIFLNQITRTKYSKDIAKKLGTYK